MLFEIKSNINGSVIFKLETKSLKLCVEAAVKSHANLYGANLFRADLSGVDLSHVDLSHADLSHADLYGANLYGADLSGVDLSGVDLSHADLSHADLSHANLSRADLYGANITETKSLIKIIGVEVGNYYWKRFEKGLKNNDYQFQVGINKLRDGEVFSADERVTCSYPGFHFASRSWCAVNYANRPLEAKIRIPKGAKINEPWTTDGKASADMIEIIQIFDVKTGKDVTDEYR